jgi:hypothetical protein
MLRKRKKSPHNLKVRGSNPLPATKYLPNKSINYNFALLLVC